MRVKASAILSVLTAVLVLFLAANAFVLSYDALRQLAEANGFPNWRSLLWPLTLDAIVVAAGLSVIRCNVVKEKAWLPWAMVGVFTIASIAFNILHAPEHWLARSIASLPPFVVFLALELLSGQIRSTVEAADKAYRKAKKEEEGALVPAQLESGLSFPAPISHANAARIASKEQAIQLLVVFYSENPNATQEEAGNACGRSRSWVSNRLPELEQAGVIERNGEGVNVLRLAWDDGEITSG